MPGKILNSATRADIARCHIAAVQYSTDRAALIAIWRAAKLSLGDGKELKEVTAACSKRTSELERGKTK